MKDIQEKKVNKIIELMLSGGLGNQMFEYACARSQQLDYGGEIVINTSLYESDRYGRQFSLERLNISQSIKVINKKRPIVRLLGGLGDKFPIVVYDFCSLFGYYIWRKRYFHSINCNNNKNVLYGYFQTHQFFEKHDETIKRELKIKEKERAINTEVLKEIFNSNSVCVHVRRGDYVAEKLITCDILYYQRAIEIIQRRITNPKFFVFSDDIEWVMNNLVIENAVYVDNDNQDYEELQLMYSCKHFIICNSSFSWWAQYLSESKEKVVVAPSTWVPGETTQNDIFQDDWIML